jgi:hypothetical protein
MTRAAPPEKTTLSSMNRARWAWESCAQPPRASPQELTLGVAAGCRQQEKSACCDASVAQESQEKMCAWKRLKQEIDWSVRCSTIRGLCRLDLDRRGQGCALDCWLGSALGRRASSLYPVSSGAICRF